MGFSCCTPCIDFIRKIGKCWLCGLKNVRQNSDSLPSGVGDLYFPCCHRDNASPPPLWSWLQPEDTPSLALSHSEPPPPHSFGSPEPRCTPAASQKPDCGFQFLPCHPSSATLPGCLPWSPWSLCHWLSGGRWLPAKASEPPLASRGQRLDASHTLPKRRWQDERPTMIKGRAREKRKTGKI